MTSPRCQRDFELDLPPRSRRLEGYPSFAHFVAKDKEAAIYRKFQHLSARSLLYQQSYIHDLEHQLASLDEEDAKDIENEKAQQVARYWKSYSEDDGRAAQHRESQVKIKSAIKEYRKCIVR